MTFSGFNISNCFFYNCDANSAGCLICNEDLTLLHSTFKDCSAKSNSGVFEQRSQNFKTNDDIQFCTFSKCQSKFYGCFHSINFGGQFKMKFTNISLSRSTKNIGCFEIDNYSATIEFLIVNTCQSLSTNGCISARRMNSIAFKNCLFKNCSQKTSKINSAAVFFTLKNKKISTIDKCFFLWNDPSNSSTISVKKDGSRLLISNSFFTGKKNEEILQNKMVIVEDSVVFGFKCRNGVVDDFIKNQNDNLIVDKSDAFDVWKSHFSYQMSDNIFGCIFDLLKKESEDNSSYGNNKDELSIDDFSYLLMADENEKELFFVHFLSFLFSFTSAFIIQKMTKCT